MPRDIIKPHHTIVTMHHHVPDEARLAPVGGRCNANDGDMSHPNDFTSRMVGRRAQLDFFDEASARYPGDGPDYVSATGADLCNKTMTQSHCYALRP
jgi:hypothetical protein